MLLNLFNEMRAAKVPVSLRELLDLIEAHRRGRLPLVVPLTLLAHHARRLRATYLLGQTYLSPGPEELRLRNHA